MTEHLGHEKHDLPEVGPGNIRNGTRSKTVLTEPPPVRSRSTCRAIGKGRSIRRSPRSANDGTTRIVPDQARSTNLTVPSGERGSRFMAAEMMP